MQGISTRRLDCGATLVMERMSGVRSAAMSWLLAAGTASEPDNRQGLSAILSELIFRGAGDLDSRAHSDALDTLGIARQAGAHSRHMTLGATMLGDRVSEALPLLVNMVRSPLLPKDSFDPVRDLCLQSLAGLDDEPQEKTMVALREHHLKSPYNRSTYGRLEGLEGASLSDVHSFWENRFRPVGSIIGVAGDIDPDELTALLNQLLAGWTGDAPEPDAAANADRGMHHQTDSSAQVHIGVMYDAPKETDERSMLERVATAVLSGGMSGRLFTEVRERRSLCYAIHAGYAAGRDEGRVVSYAGTTPERAQETLDVLAAELQRLGEGVEEAEFQRAVTGLKSRIVMAGESTASRASSLASDIYVRGAARSLDELAAAVDAVTLDAVNAHLAKRDLGNVTTATIGPTELKSPF